MKQNLNTIIIAVAVIITGFLLANGYKNRSKVTDAISVTGSGEENFTSDLIVWRGSFSKKNYDLKTAYSELNKDQQAIRKYLSSKGIKSDELIFEAVDIQKDFFYEYDQNGQLRNTVFNGISPCFFRRIIPNDCMPQVIIYLKATMKVNRGSEFRPI